MTKQYQDCLQRYELPEFKAEWAAIRRGIEKESLRVSPQGEISPNPHPAALGSALANDYITTDFSEALLEFITPAFKDIDECLKTLENIHRFSLQHLENDEILWVSSMPCPLGSEESIPIAQYGSSNIGQMKTLYRHGLSHRYGSLMQVIAGLHYNFSMPDAFWEPYQKICGHTGSLQDFRTERYLHLIRNFHRYSWLLIYLFGASPAACKCFAQGREHGLQMLDQYTLYAPNATCLRMGKLGYKSEAQKSLFVCYNELDTYIECLHNAMHTPYADYEAIGQYRLEQQANGEEVKQFQQINSNLLQLENEFYSTIRPKPLLKPGQRPLAALQAGGIEYIEVRALDLNPYLPLGIDATQIRFLDTFLLHCLLADSPVCNKQEFFEVGDNIARVVENGRDPDLSLNAGGTARLMKDWAGELLTDLQHSAGMLDHLQDTDQHAASLQAQADKLADPALTPSGRMLNDMQSGQMSFFEFSMAQSRQHAEELRNGGLDSKTVAEFETAAAKSIAKQKEIEAADTLSFAEFLDNWNSQ